MNAPSDEQKTNPLSSVRERLGTPKFLKTIFGLLLTWLLITPFEDYYFIWFQLSQGKSIIALDYLFIGLQAAFAISLIALLLKKSTAEYLIRSHRWIWFVIAGLILFSIYPAGYRGHFDRVLLVLFMAGAINFILHTEKWKAAFTRIAEWFKPPEGTVDQREKHQWLLILVALVLIASTALIAFGATADRGLYMDDYWFAARATKFTDGGCCNSMNITPWRQLTHWALGRWCYLEFHAEYIARLIHAIIMLANALSFTLLLYRLSSSLYLALLALFFSIYSFGSVDAYLWMSNSVNPLACFFGLAMAHFWLSALERNRGWAPWACAALGMYCFIPFTYDSPAAILGILPALALFRVVPDRSLGIKKPLIKTVIIGAVAVTLHGVYWYIWMRHAFAMKARQVGTGATEGIRSWIRNNDGKVLNSIIGPDAWAFSKASIAEGIGVVSSQPIMVTALVIAGAAGLAFAYIPATSKPKSEPAGLWMAAGIVWFIIAITPYMLLRHNLYSRMFYFALLGSAVTPAAFLTFALHRAKRILRFALALVPVAVIIGSALGLAGMGSAMAQKSRLEEKIMGRLIESAPLLEGTTYLLIPEDMNLCLTGIEKPLRNRIIDSFRFSWVIGPMVQMHSYNPTVSVVTLNNDRLIENFAPKASTRPAGLKIIDDDDTAVELSAIVPATVDCSGIKFAKEVFFVDQISGRTFRIPVWPEIASVIDHGNRSLGLKVQVESFEPIGP